MLNSYFDTGATVDFLVYTTTEYRATIESRLPGKPVNFFEKNFVKTMNHARISKVDIFDYPEIANYDKIVYIDADTMFLSDPTPLFDTIVDDVVYASGEGNIMYEGNYWGKYLFLKNDANYPDQEGFSVSCMGFKNLPEIKKLFSKIKQAFYLDMYQNKLAFYDQPYFNMILIANNMVNKIILKYGWS
jgi:lipopolysaccharide biosynthesis glycosyltransferase